MATITGVTGKTVTGTDLADTIYVKGAATGYGKNGNDTLIGDAAANNLQGDGGNDTIKAGSGNDAVFGGSGNDSLYGEAGNDKMWGGDGDDYLNGGSGYDSLDGGNGKDRLAGGAGDILSGGADDDILELAFGASNISSLSSTVPMGKVGGGTGNDTFRLNSDSFHYNFNDGAKEAAESKVYLDGYYSGTTYVDQSFGAVGGSDLEGSSNVVFDISSIERIEFGGTNKAYLENRGDQSITVIGSNQADTLLGGGKVDNLSGGNGNDIITGGGGADILNGGAGNDLIQGEAGNDRLTGGSGNDTFRFSDDDGKDTITDFVKGADHIHLLLTPLSGVKMVQSGADTVITYNTYNTADVLDTITLVGVTGVKLGVDILSVSE